MPSSATLLMWIALLGVLSSTVLVVRGGTTCVTDPVTLRAARLNATRAYVNRLNFDLAHYITASDRYYTEDTRMVLRGIGSFDTLQVAKEYGYVLFNESTFAIDLQELFQGKLFQVLDEPTITWPDDDTVQFWQTADVKLAPIFDQPGQFRLASGGVRNYETLHFEACSDRIKSDIVVSDRAILPIYTANNEIDIGTLCTRIMARCTGDLQQYDSVAHCMTFMQSLDARQTADPESACPYRLTSNSTACRSFHTTNALVDPAVHCSHTAIDSPKCVDTCRPACSNCPAHSHCTGTYANATTEVAVYACACDDGYVAAPGSVGPYGATSCVPTTCTADWECGAPYGFCDTATNRCGCPYTFEWDPINGGCHCPTDYVLTWDVPATNTFGISGPACKPPGGCLARQHCTDQSWNRVQCAATRPPSTVSAWLACQCNPGFVGGWTSACECPLGASRVFWSATVQGEVCLAAGECTDDWHCSGSGSCTISPGAIVGNCA